MARFDLDSYETVAQRLNRAHVDHPDLRVITDIVNVQRDDAGRALQYIIRAQIWIGEVLKAQDFAEETVGTSPVNKVSALENGCTSAIGRALADMGYAGVDVNNKPVRPSREEMEKVQRYEEKPTITYTQDQIDGAREMAEDVKNAPNLDELKMIHDIALGASILHVPHNGTTLLQLIIDKKKELETTNVTA